MGIPPRRQKGGRAQCESQPSDRDAGGSSHGRLNGRLSAGGALVSGIALRAAAERRGLVNVAINRF
jgi:hypothetical protein